MDKNIQELYERFVQKNVDWRAWAEEILEAAGLRPRGRRWQDVGDHELRLMIERALALARINSSK